nr:MAG TPA: DNA adenine methylase [Caudoviricetes sp.]
MMMPRILNYPGSKWSMASWIISHMPDHSTYLEPYFGSGAVFFNKSPSAVETINDLDGQIVNLFRVLRDAPDDLARVITFTPLARAEYERSYQHTGEPLEDARRFLIRCWQGIGGKTSDRTGWRALISANGPHVIREWDKLPQKLLIAAARLKQAQIENQPALKLIDRYDRPDVLIYADPPYILSTRTKRHYACEMTLQDHAELLDRLRMFRGSVLLSAYHHPLYDQLINEGWKMEEFQAKAESGASRTEVLWINPVAARTGFYQESLFDAE